MGLCLNGEFRPDILLKWNQLQTQQGSYVVRDYIKKALKEIDELLRQKINKWVGCQYKDLIDENGKVGVGFLEQMFTLQEGGGGRIHWKWKYQNKNNIEKINLAANYHNDCQRLKEKRVICKIEPQFVNKNIQDEVRKSIEEKLEKTIENLVNRWLNEGIWTGQNLCIFSNKFKPENNGCLKSGKIGEDNSLKTDIEKLIDKNSGRQEKINIEIGDWWLSGRWKNNSQNNEWGRREGKSDGKGVTWKLIEFAGSIGQLSTEALKQAVKELAEEFERMLINQKGDLCGIWNTGITCPDGGVILYKR